MKKSLVDMTIENIAEEQEISVKEAQKQFLKNSEVIELDSIQQAHNWVDRGLKMTCETPAHPYHEIWKRRSPVV